MSCLSFSPSLKSNAWEETWCISFVMLLKSLLETAKYCFASYQALEVIVVNLENILLSLVKEEYILIDG